MGKFNFPRGFLAILVLFWAENTISVTASSLKPKLSIRLPLNVRPSLYKIQLIPRPDPESNFTLDGQVTITFAAADPTSQIILHLKGMKVDERAVKVFSLVDGAESSVRIANIAYDTPRDFFIVNLSSPLVAKKAYNLYIKYSAVLNKNLVGFYRSSYTDKETNETRWLAATQFSPTDARRAFPCFDEPSFKAEFEISIARKKHMISLSNMEIKSMEPFESISDWIWDHYERTVPMSTYIVAFIVCDFPSRPADPGLSTTKFTMWARKDVLEQTEYARHMGPRMLTFFENYFNVPFPLPKQDMIALPDLNPSAMENWGVITYRESTLLFDQRGSSVSDLKKTVTTIGHEIAHQWFGNLVTPSWWAELWLKEGFATYMEIIALEELEPDMKMAEQCVIDNLQFVFSLDALESSHPINQPLDSLDDVSEIFDSVSYLKGNVDSDYAGGPSIIRMMHHFLTDKTFRLGLTHYLNTWKYKATTQDNLWDSLTEQAWADQSLIKPLSVKEIMDTWTLQKGYPVVHVLRNYVEGTANFTQVKYRAKSSEKKKLNSPTWWIPISYASPKQNADFNNTEPIFWIPKTETSKVEKVKADKKDWIIVNTLETGYYRVNYDLQNWKLLTEQLNSDYFKIHTINRAQIIDDALNLAKSSHLPYEVAFGVTKYLKNELEYVPWKAFSSAVFDISNLLEKTPAKEQFQTYMRDLLSDQYRKIGRERRAEEPMLMDLLRSEMVSWACKVGVEQCIQDSKSLFASLMNSSDPQSSELIPTNIASTVYCTALKYGGEKEWNFLWQQYRLTNFASGRVTIIKALACTREVSNLNNLLNDAIDESSGIRKQDGEALISSVARSDVGSVLAFNFLQSRWPEIKDHFPGLFVLGRLVAGVTKLINNQMELNQLKDFKIRYADQLGSAQQTLDQSIERAEANVQWHEDNYEIVRAWLEENSISSSKKIPIV